MGFDEDSRPASDYIIPSFLCAITNATRPTTEKYVTSLSISKSAISSLCFDIVAVGGKDNIRVNIDIINLEHGEWQ